MSGVRFIEYTLQSYLYEGTYKFMIRNIFKCLIINTSLNFCIVPIIFSELIYSVTICLYFMKYYKTEKKVMFSAISNNEITIQILN